MSARAATGASRAPRVCEDDTADSTGEAPGFVKVVAGSVPPLITPLHPDCSLDVPALERQLDRMVGGVDALLVLGTTAELAVLPDGVPEQVVDVVVGRVGGHVPLVLGVGAAGTAQAVDNLRRVRAGITAVAATTPYYFPAAHELVVAHYTALADASPVPLLLYNIPQNTHVDMTVDAVVELARHPNVAGIKDSSGDVDLFAALLELRTDDFAVLQGTRQAEMAALLRAGSDGFVAGIENVVPGLVQAVIAAIESGDAAAEHAAVARVALAGTILTHGDWLAALKVAVAMLVGSGETPAAPVARVTDAGRRAIRDILVELGLQPV